MIDLNELESCLTFAIREEAMTRSRGWIEIADDWNTLIRGYRKKIDEIRPRKSETYE